MFCPFCPAEDTKVIDSRLTDDGSQVRRRRECNACNERFTTFEHAELAMPRIIKRDGTRVVFSIDKLREGFVKALEKRPVDSDKVDLAVSHIMHTLRTTGEREVNSEFVGEQVMQALKALDQVAYVRFASVYRSFQDVNEFREEVERLAKVDTVEQ